MTASLRASLGFTSVVVTSSVSVVDTRGSSGSGSGPLPQSVGRSPHLSQHFISEPGRPGPALARDLLRPVRMGASSLEEGALPSQVQPDPIAQLTGPDGAF